MFCLGLTTFQPGDVGVEASDVGVVDACVGSGEVLKVDVAVDDSGVLVEDAGGAVVDGASLELSTTWWAPSCMSSLIARVTSMMSVAT